MSCHEYESAIVDLARGVPGERARDAALRAHLEDCAACGATLRREQRLTLGLHALAATTRVPESSALEAQLLERFDAERATVTRRVARLDRWSAAAAVLVMLVGLGAAWRTIRTRPDAIDAVSQGEDLRFVPWPGAAALPAFESGQLVRTELPASVLPLLGLSSADAPAGGHVIADVLYGQDGLARAVRVVKQQSMQP